MEYYTQAGPVQVFNQKITFVKLNIITTNYYETLWFKLIRNALKFNILNCRFFLEIKNCVEYFTQVGPISNSYERFVKMGVTLLQSSLKDPVFLIMKRGFSGVSPSQQLKRNYFYEVAMEKQALAVNRFSVY